ncbi:glycosyltransferase [Stieleria sp. TO1_6]|uniref:glycosyltransferase family 2 protein n=1 Tax=Stieleria tagensis TaxID=2956795 RepID=UPI00209B1B35|nr:glycosyltransferase family 2 protein [Stieleria tagensis]MCO8120679.1 glycosyltransferase [Stieleria tagensis]
MKPLEEIFHQLPEPPEGKTGWPWTLDSDVPHPPTSALDELPSISIVTPSFNQGRYIEETIRSVLLQGYPKLQFIVIDGGSTDQTVEILQKYGSWIDYWVSESDEGQSDAINKGFARCSGDVINWLCSDDSLTPNAAWHVGIAMRDPTVDVLLGDCKKILIYDDGHSEPKLHQHTDETFDRLPYDNQIAQPSCFYRRSLISRSPAVDRSLYYCMDRELWCYLAGQSKHWKVIHEVLSVYPHWPESKTETRGREAVFEHIRVARRYGSAPVSLLYLHALTRWPAQRLIHWTESGRVARASRWYLKNVSRVLAKIYGIRSAHALSWWGGISFKSRRQLK